MPKRMFVGGTNVALNISFAFLDHRVMFEIKCVPGDPDIADMHHPTASRSRFDCKCRVCRREQAIQGRAYSVGIIWGRN